MVGPVVDAVVVVVDEVVAVEDSVVGVVPGVVGSVVGGSVGSAELHLSHYSNICSKFHMIFPI